MKGSEGSWAGDERSGARRVTTSCTREPRRAEVALGTTAAVACLTREDLFMEVLPITSEFWGVLCQEKGP